MNVMELIRTLSSLRLAPNSAGLDECTRILCRELPFVVREFSGGDEVNGWVCPMKWEVQEAKIFDEAGSLVYDGMEHPLGVIGYSQPYQGILKGSELKEHLHFSEVFSDAIVYHCDLYYKPFRKDWGFSIPRNIYDIIQNDANYAVSLKTTFLPGTMKVVEFVLPGQLEESIVINAHNCHAFCCNDDLAGVALGVEIMRQLTLQKNRKYTYRLIVGPEHYGSIFYLNSLTDRESKLLKWGIFLEMLGTKGPLVLQRSFTGNSFIDRAIINVLKHSNRVWDTQPFRQVVGNDETCWEAPGYEIPFPCLSRWPYDEYHTSYDSPELMDEDKLNDALEVVLAAIDIMEKDATIDRKFKGLVALSHPKYDLYKPFWDPSEKDRTTISIMEKKWNNLMNCLPRYFDNNVRILEIAEKHELPFHQVYEYVKQFEDKDLVRIKPAFPTDPAIRLLSPL